MRAIAALVVSAGALALTACSNDTGTTTLTVSAAASLTDAFTEIGEQYMAENPGVEIRFNFAGSSTLAQQINAGAPVDVFAAASDKAMQVAFDAGSVLSPEIFTTNAMTIAVPAGNPAAIDDLSDLADPNVTVVMCDAVVPCGSAAVSLLELNGLQVTPASLEPDVRAVLTKVIADEADAGIVYRSDIAAAGAAVEGIAIPDDRNVVNGYPIAATVDASPAAQDFIDHVLSDAGQSVLARWGFRAP